MKESLDLTRPKYGTYSLSSYLSSLSSGLGELLLLGLTNFVRPNSNTQKTKIVDLAIDREWNYA